MKTRIIYPSMWDQDRVADLSKDAKVLLFNLLTTGCQGLTKYLKLGDRKIQMETGLTRPELEKAKAELASCDIHWIDGWWYLGHDFGYVDYEGRDRVLAAKQRELDAVPREIVTAFELVVNRLETPYQPVLNYKSKTLIPKPEEVQEESAELDLWRSIVGTKIRQNVAENRKAGARLHQEFSEGLAELLMAVRMIRADRYQKRKLQEELTGFVGMEKNIEQIERYVQSNLDQITIGKSTQVIPGK